MTAPDTIASRLIGTLFVERGLVSESQIRVALEIQRETGEQLGQILVQRFGVSRKELARVVAEQWKDMGRGGVDGAPGEDWRPLGEIFVTRGFISEEELDSALKRQRKTGERLGEALVGLGIISKFELAGALAEQMASLGEMDDDSTHVPEANVVPLHATPASSEDMPYGALTPDPPAAEHDDAESEAIEEAVDQAPEPLIVEPASNGDVALEHFDADGAAEEEPALELPEEVEADVALVAETADSAPFELAQPIDLWPDAPQDVEPEAELPEAQETIEPDHEPVPQAERFDPEPERVGIDPEPHFELEADVPESIGTWHLLVAEPEARPGLCVAFAPTRAGYRLVPLPEVPSVGETIDVAEVGPVLVLRVGASPLPNDARVCAYVEGAVVPVAATG